MFISSLSIKNFRGIKEGKIEGLGQINIFIGKNNSGKSTLLDSLCFIKAPLKPQNDFGEFVLESLLQRRVKRQVCDENEFFHQYLEENEVNFEARFDDGFPLHFKAKKDGARIHYTYLPPDSEKPVATFQMRAGEPPTITARSSQGHGIQDPLTYIFAAYGGSPPGEVLAPWARSAEAQGHLGFISDIVLIDADFVRKIEGIEDAYWADILKRRKDKILKRILNQTYGLPIENFSFANYRNKKSKIFVMLPEISMHIDDYGDGFRYAFSILTVASQAKNTALLLEEPEVHQHEGALRPLFEAFAKLASNNRLQIFISTHSPSVIEIWTQLAEDVRIYHLTLSAEGKLETRPIPSADARLMMDLGTSPLKLDEEFSYLVLEGKQDRIFFESVAKKLKQKSLKDLRYEVVESPKSEQKTTVSALASTGKPIVSCIDFDKSSNIPDLIKPLLGSLKNKYPEIEVTDNRISVKSTGSIITVVPIGLPDDKELSEIGISKYALEDFAIKLLCVDSNIQEWARINLEELRSRAQSFKDKAPLNASKTLLMTLGVIKEGKTLEELIPEIINKSDSKMLVETLKPFVVQLFG